ncbi:hypothetical protein C8R43DRAFT_946794 [Mycena crocata]|nr:hypothetical protein C8R43DRAFT_946794 [Mycena crocata]
MSPPRTRTSAASIRQWGRPVKTILTFDICRQLVSQERKLHAATFGVAATGASYHTDADESESAASDSDEGEQLLVNARYIWSKGRRVRLLGSLQREHEAKLKPVLDVLADAKRKRAASRCRPKATWTRPWTSDELELNFQIHPSIAQYTVSDLPLYFAPPFWNGRDLRLVVDRTHFVIAVLGGSGPGNWNPVVQKTNYLLEHAVTMFSEGALALVDVGVAYSDDPEQYPANLVESETDGSSQIVRFLMDHVPIQRLYQNAQGK